MSASQSANVATSACIIVHEKALLVRRNKDEGFLAGYWELPGGKVEQGETIIEGLVREVKEEIGVDCVAGAEFDSFSFTTSKGVPMVNKSFLVSIASHDFVLTEHDASAWVTEHDLEKYQITPEMKTCIRKGFRSVSAKNKKSL